MNDSCHAYETLQNSQISNLTNSYKSTVDQIINNLQTMDTSRQKFKNRKVLKRIFEKPIQLADLDIHPKTVPHSEFL